MQGVPGPGQPDRRAWLLVAAVAGITLLLASVAFVAPATGTGFADLGDDHDQEENGEAPMAEAGLDQEADVEATVYLDAGGSWAPEGEIESFEWSIERPDGTSTSPACPTCEMTSFVPHQVGVYNVTLTVTATNGLNSSDTMYVTVSDREPPTATLTGPAQVNVSETATLTLDAEAGTHPLMAVSWYVNGDINHSAFLEGSAPWEESFTFDEAGVYEIGADVVDESGYSALATHELRVGSNASYFAVRITNTTSPVSAKETLAVTAEIENTGTVPDTQNVTLADGNGTVRDELTDVSLGPGESTTRTFRWSPCLDPQIGGVSVRSEDDRDETDVEIDGAACSGVRIAWNVMLTDVPDAVYPGQRINIDVESERWMLYSSGESPWDYDHKEHLETLVNKRGTFKEEGEYMEIDPLLKYHEEQGEKKITNYDANPLLRVNRSAPLNETGFICVTRDPSKYETAIIGQNFTRESPFDERYRTHCKDVEIAPKEHEDVEEVGELNVRLVDKHGNPLDRSVGTRWPRVTHDQQAWSMPIDKNGWANFTELPSGDLRIYAMADGYTEKAIVDIENHNPTTIRVQFDEIYPTGEVSIHVWDTYNNEWVEDALVRFDNDLSGSTDENGRWITEAEVQDLVEIEVKKDGETAWTWVDIEEDQITSKRVEMELVPTGEVQFWVVDLQDDPVEGARVQIDGETVGTGHSGTASFVLEEGTYEYSVRKDGELEQGHVTIRDGDTVYEPVTLPLSGQGTLQVTVTDAYGEPIPGAQVSEDTPGSPAFSGQTDYSGRVEFTVDEGTYDVTAEKEGDEHTRRNIEITRGETTEIAMVVIDGCDLGEC